MVIAIQACSSCGVILWDTAIIGRPFVIWVFALLALVDHFLALLQNEARHCSGTGGIVQLWWEHVLFTLIEVRLRGPKTLDFLETLSGHFKFYPTISSSYIYRILAQKFSNHSHFQLCKAFQKPCCELHVVVAGTPTLLGLP